MKKILVFLLTAVLLLPCFNLIPIMATDGDSQTETSGVPAEASASGTISSFVKTYPNYAKKAVTFSFDDGDIIKDSKIISYLNKYGLKATFNLITSKIVADPNNITDAEKETMAQFVSAYAGHELANHTNTHPWMLAPNESHPEEYSLDMCKEEFATAQEILLYMSGESAVGGAWPYGVPSGRDFYSDLMTYISGELGIEYLRSVKVTNSFALPEDFLEWKMTCHQDAMQGLTDDFINLTVADDELAAFSVWGHAYEMEATYKPEEDKLRFYELDAAFSAFADRDEYWACTNAELCLYAKAMDTVVVDYTASTVTNPSNTDLHFIINGTKVMIPAGETADFSEGNVDCDHYFNVENPTAAYLKSEANCQSPAVYYKSCSCGDVGDFETFIYGEVDPSNHTGGITEEITEEGTVIKYICCGKIKEIVTSYGTIPEEYCNSEAYPFIVFKNGEFSKACTHWSSSDSSSVLQSLYSPAGQGADVTVLMRRDYTFSTSDVQFNNIIYISYSAVTIDLGGYTLESRSEVYIFYCQIKGTSQAYTQIREWTVKNGDIKNPDRVLYLQGSTTNAQGVSFTFDEVNFTNVQKNIVYVGSTSLSNEFTASITFNKCTAPEGLTIKRVNTSNTDTNFNLTVTYNHNYSLSCDTVCDFCGEERTIDGGGHIYDREIADSTYFITAPTCQTGGTYYKSCACGAASDSETFTSTDVDSSNHTEDTVTEEITEEGTVKKYTCCGKVKEIVTSYGTIPEEYCDAEVYPFIIFGGTNVYACSMWASSTDSDTSAVMNCLKNKKTTDNSFTVLMRRDYTFGSGDTVYENFIYIYQSGGITVDLGGHTLTNNTANSMFNTKLKGASYPITDTRVWKIMNGNISSSKPIVDIYVNTACTALGVNYIFEDISFVNLYGSIVNVRGSMKNLTQDLNMLVILTM